MSTRKSLSSSITFGSLFQQTAREAESSDSMVRRPVLSEDRVAAHVTAHLDDAVEPPTGVTHCRVSDGLTARGRPSVNGHDFLSVVAKS